MNKFFEHILKGAGRLSKVVGGTLSVPEPTRLPCWLRARIARDHRRLTQYLLAKMGGKPLPTYSYAEQEVGGFHEALISIDEILAEAAKEGHPIKLQGGELALHFALPRWMRDTVYRQRQEIVRRLLLPH